MTAPLPDLPWEALGMVPPPRRVLVVVAHYDDEALFCGGTLLALARAGCRLHVAVVTDVRHTNAPPSPGSRSPEWEAERQARRLAAFDATCRDLGADSTHFHQENLAERSAAVGPTAATIASGTRQALAALLATFRPHLVMTHGACGEYGHAQHVLTHRVVQECWRGPLVTFALPHPSPTPRPGSPRWFSLSVDQEAKAQLLGYYREHTTQEGTWDPSQVPAYTPWCEGTEYFTAHAERSERVAPARRAAEAPVLLYCQSSLGVGHYQRCMALAAAISRERRTIVLSGGLRSPLHSAAYDAIEQVDLPPIVHDADGRELLTGDREISLEKRWAERRRVIEATVRLSAPVALVLDYYPFGKRDFQGEIQGLIEAVRVAAWPRHPLVISSLRDIVEPHATMPEYYAGLAVSSLEKHFDHVLVHSDPAFLRIEDSFSPPRPLRTPVHYTGFVMPPLERPAPQAHRDGPILVTAGGGRVGLALLRATAEAARDHGLAREAPVRLITGPHLPDSEWEDLQRLARGVPGLALERWIDDVPSVLARARASVSQAGYNTVVEILHARVPSVLVPWSQKATSDQAVRARRLADLGLAEAIDHPTITAATLAQSVRNVVAKTASWPTLAFDGAERTAILLDEFLARTASPS